MTSFWQNLWRWMLGGSFNPSPAPPPISPPTAYISPKPAPPAPPKPPTRVIIAGRGDTLFTLAEKHHTTVQAIARLNNIHPQRPLHAGQRLVIPDFDAGNIVASPAETDFIAPKLTLEQPVPEAVPVHQKPKPPAPAPKSHPPKPKPVPSKPAQKAALIPPTPEKLFTPPTEAVAALYLSHHEAGIATKREAILARLDDSFFNALVIDFKDDWGYVSHPVANAITAETGAHRSVIRELPALVETLRKRNVRPIARVVAFKDNLISQTMPHLAAQMPNDGRVWRNDDHFGWLDPFQPEVWAYLQAVARAAAEIGFAEVQFDRLQFPQPSGKGTPRFCRPTTPANRCNALAAFLSAVRGELSGTGAALSMTVAGYACHRTDDFGTGQLVPHLAAYADVLAPLVYPSHFTLGLPGCPDPLRDPACAVETTLRAVRQRLGDAVEIRPWLQDFAWDANGTGFSPAVVNAQIRATFSGGADGFGLWRVA